MQYEFFTFYYYGMSCIWTPLEPGNNVILVRQVINNLSLALVSPLRSNHDRCRHHSRVAGQVGGPVRPPWTQR